MIQQTSTTGLYSDSLSQDETPQPQTIDVAACSAYVQELEKHLQIPAHAPDFGNLAGIVEEIEEEISSGASPQVIRNLIDTYKKAPAFAALFEASRQERAPAKLNVTRSEDIAPALEWGLLPKEKGIGVSRWFDEYLAFSKKWSPRACDIQHKGCALWLLSTIAARRIAVHYGGLQYTPLYIAQVAPSTVWGKSTTAKIPVIDFLQRAGFGWLLGSDAPSPEKLLSNMAGKYVPENWDQLTEEEQTFETKRLAHSGQVGWHYSELGQLLTDMANDKGRNAAFKHIIRRMDDGEPRIVPSDTHRRGREPIDMPYLALLGDMTPDCMKAYSTSDASSWGDGTYARFAFCSPPHDQIKTRDQLRAERFPDGEKHLPTSLLMPLRAWNTQLKERECEVKYDENRKGFYIDRGEFPLTTYRLGRGVKDALDDYGDALALLAQDQNLQQFQSCYARLRDKTLRIATLIASLEKSQEVELCHLAFAQHIAEEFRESLHHLDRFLHQNNFASKRDHLEKEIIDYLSTCIEPKTAREIRNSNRACQEKTPDDLRKMLNSLARDGVIHKVEKQSGQTAERYEARKK